MNDKVRENWTLITGASQGIGKAIAEACAKREMNLFLVALPDSGLGEVADYLAEKYHVGIEFLETDLTRCDSCETIYSYSTGKNLNINILVNNAGIGHNGHMSEITAEETDQMIMLNIRATALLTQMYLRDLLKQPAAHILFMGSMAAYTPLPGKSIYAASKAFILFFSKALAMEIKNSRVSVTSVYPYGVRTNPRVRERIEKSGIIAKSAVLKAEEVAEIAVDGMMKGKKVIIPGKIGKVLFYTGFIIPQGIVLWALEREIKRALK